MIQGIKRFLGMSASPDGTPKISGKGMPEPKEPVAPAEGSVLTQHFYSNVYSKVVDAIGLFQPKLVTIADRILMQKDPDVAFGTAVLGGPVLNAEYSVKGEDPICRAFIELVIEDKFDEIARAALPAIRFGYQVVEKVWQAVPVTVEVQDAQGGAGGSKSIPVAWTFRKFKGIDPRTINLHVDQDTDEWDGVQQHIFYGTGKVASTPVGLVGPERVALWSYRKSEVWGRLTGFAQYDQSYIPWWDKSATSIYANRYYEQYGGPVPIGRADASGRLNVDGVTVDGFTFMGGVMGQYKTGNGIILPSDRDEMSKQYLYDIEYKELSKGGESFVAYLNYKAQQILQGLWTPQRVGQATGGSHLGSKEPQVQADQMQEFHEEILKEFFSFLNEQIVQPLGRFNFPAEQWEAAKVCVVPSGISAGQRMLYKDILLKCFDEEMSLGPGKKVPLMRRIKLDGLLDDLDVEQVSADELAELEQEAEQDAQDQADLAQQAAQGGGKVVDDPAIQASMLRELGHYEQIDLDGMDRTVRKE